MTHPRHSDTIRDDATRDLSSDAAAALARRSSSETRCHYCGQPPTSSTAVHISGRTSWWRCSNGHTFGTTPPTHTHTRTGPR